MGKAKKKLKQKGLNKKTKVLLLSIMSVVVALSIATAVIFGFKLYLYGKEFKVTLNPNGGKVSPITKVVEFGKKYSLPKAIKDGEVFAYWQVRDGNKKVELKGVWTIDKDVVLDAVWQSDIEEKDWTDNY